MQLLDMWEFELGKVNVGYEHNKHRLNNMNDVLL